jgi:hypothetical protein
MDDFGGARGGSARQGTARMGCAAAAYATTAPVSAGGAALYAVAEDMTNLRCGGQIKPKLNKKSLSLL